MPRQSSAGEPWSRILHMPLANSESWPATNLPLTSVEKHNWRVMTHRPQLETSCSLGCGFGMCLQDVFRELLFWPLEQWVLSAGVGLAPMPKWEQRELGEKTSTCQSPWKAAWPGRVWGERIHYNLGKPENTVVHRPFRLCNRWCCFGWRRRQVLKQLPEIMELQPAELKRVQRIRRRNTFTWREEEELWNETWTLKAGIKFVRCF